MRADGEQQRAYIVRFSLRAAKSIEALEARAREKVGTRLAQLAELAAFAEVPHAPDLGSFTARVGPLYIRYDVDNDARTLLVQDLFHRNLNNPVA
ncbi:MAG TPA: hypothetical protein VLW85_04850 [Myxococcales bacterium]|nr:hypothetical protein [Myxococcales bacterium]